MMGGDIRVDNRPAGGSRFRFTMVAAYAEDAAPEDRTSDRGAIVGLAPGQAALRVLAVDDRSTNLDIVTRMLTRVGFEVRQAADGQAAVDLFDAWRPQAVLMDVRMPVMDGVEATQRIRALEKQWTAADPAGGVLPAVIIAVSASVMEAQRKAIMQEGLANAFVGKPFKETELLEALEKHLGVAYLFENSPAPAVEEVDDLGHEAAAERIAALPERLVTDLRRSTVNLNVDRLKELIEQAQGLDAGLAKRIARLVDGFEFEVLDHLLGSGE